MRVSEIRFCDRCRQSIPADTAWHEMPDGRELCLECWQHESAENRQLPPVQAPAPASSRVCEMCRMPVAPGDFVIDAASGAGLCGTCASIANAARAGQQPAAPTASTGMNPYLQQPQGIRPVANVPAIPVVQRGEEGPVFCERCNREIRESEMRLWRQRGVCKRCVRVLHLKSKRTQLARQINVGAVIGAGVMIICMLLPWIDAGLFSMNGLELASKYAALSDMADEIAKSMGERKPASDPSLKLLLYSLWLIPVFGIAVLAAEFSHWQHRAPVSLGAGTYALVMIVIFIAVTISNAKDGSSVFNYLGVGFYGCLLGAVATIFAGGVATARTQGPLRNPLGRGRR